MWPLRRDWPMTSVSKIYTLRAVMIYSGGHEAETKAEQKIKQLNSQGIQSDVTSELNERLTEVAHQTLEDLIFAHAAYSWPALC